MDAKPSTRASAKGPHGRPNKAAHGTSYLVAGFLLVTASALFALLDAFGRFSDYDDEGYIMVAAKHMLAGRKLYGELQTFYGPFFFLWEWVWYRLLGLPLTHDATRLRWVAVWIASSGLIAWAAFRLTRRTLLAAAAYVLAASYLWAFSQEPGHPQELCVLLVVAFVAVASGHAGRTRAALPFLAGAVAAALALTKLNIGVFFFLPIALAALASAGSDVPRSLARAFVATATMLLPFAIAAPRLGNPRILLFAGVVSLATVPLLRFGRSSTWRPGLPELGRAAAGFLSVAMVSVGFALTRGATPGTLLEGLVLMPMRLSKGLVPVTPISVLALPACAAALVLAAVHASQAGIAGRIHPRKYAAAAAVIKLTYGIWLSCRFAMGPTGGITPAWHVMALGTPFIWLALVRFPAVPREEDGPEVGRLLLCFLAAVLPFQAFPTPGSQSFGGTILMVLVAVVCINDAAAWAEGLDLPRHLAARIRTAAVSVAGLSVAGILGHHIAEAALRYRSGVSIGQPGARWVRIDAPGAATLRRLTDHLRGGTAPVFCTTGFNNIHLWSGRPPVNGLVMGNSQAGFLAILSAAQEARMIADLDRDPGTIVLTHPQFRLQPATVPVNRLYRHIADNFVTYDQIGGFELKRRRERPASDRP